MRKIFILISLLISINIIGIAQTAEVDSLENLLSNYSDSDTLKAKLLNEIAYEVQSYDLDKTLNYASLADSISNVLNYKSGKLESLQLIGRYYYYKQDMSQASSYYQQALKLGEKLENKSAVSFCNNYIGNTYLMQGDYAKAEEYYQKALVIFKELDDKVGISGCFNNIGNIYYAQGDYPKTLECFHNALKEFESLQNETGISGCLNNIGVIYDEQQNYPKALEYYQRALKIREELNDMSGISDCYNNIGNIYVYQEDYQRALDYYQKSLKINQELDDKYLISSCYYNIGIIYLSQDKYQKSLEYYQKSIKIAEEIGSQNMIAANTIEISKLYYELENYNLALKNGETAFHLSQELGERYNIKEASDILAKTYEKVGNYQKAFQYHVEYKNQSDSLQNEANTEKIVGLEYQYKYEKEKELAVIEQEKREFVLKAETKRQKTIRNAFLIGFLLMILLTLVIIRSLIQNRKANRKLARQKAEIENQAKELKATHNRLLELDQFKQGLSSMIVHDLKNPLNGIINISSSLSLESQVLKMKQAGSQMLNMVLNILDIDKYEESNLNIDKSEIVLFEIAQSAIKDIRFLAENKNINIENNIRTNTVVYADKNLLERILINLLTNATKYTPNNGHIQLDTDTLDNNKNFIKIIVTDNGQGIPANKLDLVFAKFAQVNAKSSGRVKSTGLGLAFCKMAVEAHGGTIQVKSKTNKGATFEFTLEKGSKLLKPSKIESALTQDKTLKLSNNEKQTLLPYVSKLKEIEIYKMFDIRKIIKTIDDTQETNLQQWKKEILSAIESGNKKRYNELLRDF